MRTTLTLDDDLARKVKELALSSDRRFKDVVNDVIRKGLNLGEPPSADKECFVVRAKACGFRTDVEPTKLNPLYDDLEMDSRS